jgi:hypothetical protein
MAIVKEIQIKVTDQQAEKQISSLNNLFKQVDQSVEQTEQSTVSLRTELRNLQQQMASGKLSGAEFNQAALRAGQLRDAIGDANARINVLASDTQKLDLALSVGSGLAGAFSAAQGSMALFGGESEEVQQAILKVQGSLAVLNGVQAVALTLNKDSALMVQLQTRGLGLLAVAQKAYSLAVGTSTGLLKAFRIALISTGIGAIVVAVGMLIANFESISKWVTDLIDKFGGWRKVLMFVAPPIWAIVKALEALGIIDDEETSKAKKNADERINASRKESAELDKRKTQIEAYYDFEIRKAKAAGKNTEELEAAKRQTLLKTMLLQNEQERAWIRTNKASEEDIKRWNARQAAITQLLQDIQIAETENTRKTEEEKAKLREKAAADAKKRAEEAKRQREKELAEIKKQQDDLTKIQEDAERERNKKIKKLLAELEESTKTAETPEQRLLREYQENLRLLQQAGESTLLLTAKYNSDLFALQQQQNEANRLQAEQFAQEEFEREQAIREYKENEYRTTLDNLQTILSVGGKKMQKVSQALAIADVVRSAYQSISQTISNIGAANAKAIAASPLSGGQPFVTLNTIKGALQIGATVASSAKAIQAIRGNATSVGGGGLGSGGAGGGGGEPSAPSFNLVGDAGLNQIAQTQAGQQPVEAYVVAGNVTTAQSLNRNIINNATF